MTLSKIWLASLLALTLTGCNNEPDTTSNAAIDTADTLPPATADLNAPITSEDLAEAQTQELNNATTVTPTTAPTTNAMTIGLTDKTFGMTPEQFGERFGVVAGDVGIEDGALGEFMMRTGEVNDSFVEQLSEAVSMTGTVDKNGELKSIIYMMGHTDNEDNESVNNEIMNMAMMAGLTARVLNPNATKEETGGQIIGLLNQSLADFEASGQGLNEEVVNGVKYFAIVNPDTGIWLGFEPA